MQFNANNRWRQLKIILMLAAALWIAYLPVSSFLFFIKNDAFTGYFPPKFFMSESLAAGQLPLWNPYINFGIPQYADMSSGYWSPVTWLIAATVGYNAYTFTLELLLYILLAAAGMYKLTGYYRLHPSIRLIAALAYGCCGYFTGHLQHFNWISGAALLPWCFYALQQLLDGFSLRRLLPAAILFSLLLAAAHPGISIGFAYLLLGFLVMRFTGSLQPGNLQRTPAWRGLPWLALLVGLLSAGMIAGYADVLPHFVRSSRLSLQDALLQPTTAASWISVLLPLATVKNEALFLTDISMRNGYFSLLLLLAVITALFTRKDRLTYFLLGASLFFILLAAGGFFKTLAYRWLPGMGYVRLNGEFRIFVLFCLILLGAVTLQRYTLPGNALPRIWHRSLAAISLLLVLAAGWGLCLNLTEHGTFLAGAGGWMRGTGLTGRIKGVIDQLSFGDTLIIQSLLQLAVLAALQWAMRYRLWGLLRNLVMADLVLATLLHLPFTGAGQLPVSAIDALIRQSPRGIPLPALQPIDTLCARHPATTAIIGDWSLYSKEPGNRQQAPYPIVLKGMQAYFESPEAYRQACTAHPFLYYSGAGTVSLEAYNPQQVSARIQNADTGRLILQQNAYPHWSCRHNGRLVPIRQEGPAFMAVDLPAGNHAVQWTFNPVWVKRLMLLSALAWVLTLVVWGRMEWKK